MQISIYFLVDFSPQGQITSVDHGCPTCYDQITWVGRLQLVQLWRSIPDDPSERGLGPAIAQLSHELFHCSHKITIKHTICSSYYGLVSHQKCHAHDWGPQTSRRTGRDHLFGLADVEMSLRVWIYLRSTLW